MLPQSSSTAQAPRIGVGIDTARYGHYACFLKDDLQPAAPELSFAESAAGYQQLRQRLQQIAKRYGPVHFVVRLDAAGQYADNLLHFLQTLWNDTAGAVAVSARGVDAAPRADDGADPTRLGSVAISCGDPQRNKNYRAALYGHRKSDPYEARACARYALSERPASVTPLSLAQRTLRQVAGRLQAVVRQRTRLVNQLHHLLALAFPELAVLVKDIATGWVLELVHRYPTAKLLAGAAPADLENIPYLPHAQVEPLLEHARTSIASLSDTTVGELVRDQVRQLRDVSARQKRLEKLLVSAYEALPNPNHLDTIKGLGQVTAAILTAFIADIQRFETPSKLVAYFGIMPIEAASGVERDGTPRSPKRYVMSRRGNDLVRRYLWMAALSAVQYNPAVRALYARVVKKHPDHKAVAIGHAMRKLLHLAFAIWKTGKPFDLEHYPWQTPAHLKQQSGARVQESGSGDQEAATEDSDMPLSLNEPAAGLNPVEPEMQEVSAASSITSTVSLSPSPRPRESAFVDFAHLKEQLPIARVLDQLGLTARLRGPGPQKRGPCPIHRGDGRGRTFSVHLGENVFCCFDKTCGHKGDVIDLWASVKGMSLRDAALDLVQTFNLEPAPDTPQRRGHG
jgi:transposase